MRTRLPFMQKTGGAWKRVVILVCLYALLVESLVEWVLVLYLYGISRVDATMTPSVILILSASFFSLPLVVLHSLLAWQYNRIAGFGVQKTVLHTACTYLLRLVILVWLAADVTGLMVVSQQPLCLPSGSHAGFWAAGISCQLHRAAVYVAVASFLTVCAFFCSRQLCSRPYDVSLLGVYRPRERPRNGSIFSSSSWESEGLKNEILYLCRHPDSSPGNRGLYWAAGDATVSQRPVRPPSIRYPSASLARPRLTVNTNPACARSEVASRSSISPDSSSPTLSLGERSISSDLHTVSRSSTVRSSRSATGPRVPAAQVAELPATPEVPPIPAKYIHKRAKSSVSSKKFLPRALSTSTPLSSDPQIQALADPSIPVSYESRPARPPTTFMSAPQLCFAPEAMPSVPLTPSANDRLSDSPPSPQPVDNGQRSMTMGSATAPEVVAPLSPAQGRQPDSPVDTRSIHHPHHPNYVPAPPSSQTAQRPLPRRSSRRLGSPSEPGRGRRPINNRNMSHHHYHQLHPHSSPSSPTTPTRAHQQQFHYFEQPRPSPRHPGIPPRTHSSPQHPHHQQHHYQHQQHHHPEPPISLPPRMHPHRFDPNRNPPPIPRRDDIEVIYPSTRRKRSSTYGAVSSTPNHHHHLLTGNNLDSIRESLRSSLDGVHTLLLAQHGPGSGSGLGPSETVVMDQRTYRGTNRTSFHGL